jgi:glycosyltransferase involved in cell wall biosynthesis
MPFISVIIPTRERCETLQSALKTACGQDFTDVEFIVSDNVSEDSTSAIVAEFNDPRIRYIRTPKRLSMAGNYSFALSHARGTYVTILGDDDGLIPGALSVLAQWARATGAPAISWQEATYYWPSHSLPERRGRLQIPLLAVNWNVSARAGFTAAKWSLLRWNYLPIIYGGLVKLDVMNILRDRAGEYLLSHSPDVYSAIAISSIIERYIYTEYPFSTFGFSGKSMASTVQSNRTLGKDGNTDTFNDFLRENSIAAHPDFPVGDPQLLQLESAAMADCLYRVKDAVLGGHLFIPNSMWLYRILREANSVGEPLRSEMIARLESIARKRRRRWLVHLLLRLSAAKQSLEKASSGSEQTVAEAKLTMDSTRFGVEDIYGACNLVAKLRPLPACNPNFHKAGLVDLLGLKRLKWRWTT